MNFRMSELQGAVALAQFRKLESVILPAQRKNKARIKEALAKIDQIAFRDIPDPEGDTATFITFFLPTAQKARAFNKAMAEAGAGAIYWYENYWHYYEQWEHLLEGKSLMRTGYPFKDRVRPGEAQLREGCASQDSGDPVQDAFDRYQHPHGAADSEDSECHRKSGKSNLTETCLSLAAGCLLSAVWLQRNILKIHHESTKNDLLFYLTPSSFVFSYLRVFVIRGLFSYSAFYSLTPSGLL